MALWWSSNTAHRAFHGDQCHQNLLVVGGGGGGVRSGTDGLHQMASA